MSQKSILFIYMQGGKQMESNDILTYLHNIFDIEISLFQQKRILGQLNYEKDHVVMGEYKEIENIKSKKYSGFIWICFFVHLIWFIVSLYAYLAQDPLADIEFRNTGQIYYGFLSCTAKIYDAFIGFGFDQFWSFVMTASIPACVFDMLMIFIWIWRYSSFAYKTRRYNKYAIKHNQEVSALRESVKNKIIYKMQEIEKYCIETEDVLKKMYSNNIIYPKYQNLVAVGMFCEYFDSGRCVTLEGHEGAYNIYENEIRQNIIISKLDDIIYKLDSIERNQYFVYQAIQNSNKTIKKISKELLSQIDRIEDNQYLNSYYSKVAARNTEFLAWERMFAAR